MLCAGVSGVSNCPFPQLKCPPRQLQSCERFRAKLLETECSYFFDWLFPRTQRCVNSVAVV